MWINHGQLSPYIRLEHGRWSGYRERLKLTREVETAVKTPVGVEPGFAEVNLAIWLDDESLSTGKSGIETHINFPSD
jgi:hypothetical protein